VTPLPHYYSVSVSGGPADAFTSTGPRLQPFELDAPAEFGGPGNQWSPETLLTSAVAGCFMLTFRAIARASKLEWMFLQCEVTATLERVEQATQFTHFLMHVRLQVDPRVDRMLAQRVLEKAHRGCLVANSLKASVDLRTELITNVATAA